jgi:hypothetical protein
MRAIAIKRVICWGFAVRVVAVGTAMVSGSLAQRALRPNQAESTRRMAERLQRLADSSDLDENLFLNDRRVTLFQNRLAIASRPSEQVPLRLALPEEMLRAGQTEDAIAALLRLQQEVAQGVLPADPERASWLQGMLAISYLRLGEQENCILRHGADSCLFPIRGDGIHVIERGSRAAIKIYEELLAQYPDSLEYRWLLNIAYMTLGEYPDKVPPPWLIPLEVFASDYDIKRFYDIAPRLGLDVPELAGGSIVEDLDGDGYLDIMASSLGYRDPLRFFRNNGDGTFTERSEQAGLTGIVGGLNLCHADYNNDGFPDVLVLRGGVVRSRRIDSELAAAQQRRRNV